MSKIVTITLSPAVDKSATVEKIIPEAKLICSEPKYEPGGGGVNVSRALRRLGTSSLAILPIGGATGDLLKSLLKAEKVDLEALKVKNVTRENFIVVETSSNQQFRFGMPGNMIYPAEEERLLNSIKNLTSTADYIIASGSVPPGIGNDFFAKISRIAKKTDSRFVVDTSGEALTEAIEEGVYMIKPNLRELSLLSGNQDLENELVENAARKLIEKGKCKVVVVSMGAHGAYLIASNIAEQIQAPSVKKLSTVGAGDSMVAGMIHALSKGKDLRDMVCMGIACGTAATMNPGTELFKKEDAERLYRWLSGKYHTG